VTPAKPSARELHEYTRRCIAERRLKKAANLAFLAFSCDIPASDMSRATDQEWAQLVEAARLNTKENYGVPSLDTKLMVVALLGEYECRRGKVA